MSEEFKDRPSQAVRWEVGATLGQTWIRFYTDGVPPITIPMDPQAAFEMGEKLARAAHVARFGKAPQSDGSYLHDQIRQRVTEDLRKMLIQRCAVMMNSIRNSPLYSNDRLAAEVVDTVLTKVA